MELSAERKKSLKDHYVSWGLEEVRRELRRPDRGEFVDPDVTSFAQAWVEATEVAARRKTIYSKILAAVGMVLVGLGIAGLLTAAGD